MLRVDANDIAVFAVLLQMVTVDGKVLYHPIGFKSHKFSGAACRWDTHKKRRTHYSGEYSHSAISYLVRSL